MRLQYMTHGRISHPPEAVDTSGRSCTVVKPMKTTIGFDELP